MFLNEIEIYTLCIKIQEEPCVDNETTTQGSFGHNRKVYFFERMKEGKYTNLI